MPATRSNAALLTAQTTSQTSTPATNVSTGYGGTIGVSIAQVGTPTTPSSFTVNWSPDGGTTYYALPSIQGPSAAGTNPYTVDIPIGATHVTITFTAAVGGTSSTITAQASWVATI